MPLPVWIRRLALTGLVLCFVVVVLGAYVRLSAAGLSCPDWPGCYGAPTPLGIAQDAAAQGRFPHATPDVGKAWREMIHRYAAGTLGLIIVALAVLAAASPARRIIGLRFACALLVILILQASLGMLTVTLRLAPLIVTLHLIFGMTTLALLAWLWLEREEARAIPRLRLRRANAAAAVPGGAHRPRHADCARRVDQQQLRRHRLSGFSHLPGPLVAAERLRARLRAVEPGAGHQL
jgi:cytochrome c oxidase assembly protein subunit 15